MTPSEKAIETLTENDRKNDQKSTCERLKKTLKFCVAETFENRSTSVLGGARQDKWAPSASRELSRRFFERLWRARKRFPSPFGRPGASQERSWSALGALLASEASYQKPSKGDCGRLDRQRTIWRRFSDDFRSCSIDFRANWGPSVVWLVMLLSGLCRWVVVCLSEPQSTLTHAEKSLF